MARRARILRYFGWALLAGSLALALFTAYLDVRVRSEFEGRRFALPARIYARPLELHAGLRLSEADVEDELNSLGYRSGEGAHANQTRDVPAEALMLTGDENIVDINFTVFWVIKDARRYLFDIRDPAMTVKSAAESAMPIASACCAVRQ